MFRANPSHTGVSPETAISTTNASSLAQTWTAKLGTTSDTSPAVVMNTTLRKALVYAGANNHFNAYPAGGGAAVWSYKLPAGVVETSPAVFSGVVYIGSTAGTLYALNATTGTLMCSYKAGGPILASPVAVESATGPVVYDGTIPGNGAIGAEFAMNGPGSTAGHCTQAWKFTSFAVTPGGTWSSPAYATDARGVPLVVFGSKDQDDAVYALNARTGALVWRYRTSTASLADVGASPVISTPGQNGFASGVVYVPGKDKTVYALNLTTGGLIWKYALPGGGNPTGSSGDVAGAALLGSPALRPVRQGHVRAQRDHRDAGLARAQHVHVLRLARHHRAGWPDGAGGRGQRGPDVGAEPGDRRHAVGAEARLCLLGLAGRVAGPHLRGRAGRRAAQLRTRRVAGWLWEGRARPGPALRGMSLRPAR